MTSIRNQSLANFRLGLARVESLLIGEVTIVVVAIVGVIAINEIFYKKYLIKKNDSNLIFRTGKLGALSIFIMIS